MNSFVLEDDVRQFAERFELRKELHGKSFLITGATGLIGSILIKCLLALDEDIDISIPVRSMEKATKVFGNAVGKLNVEVISSLTEWSKRQEGTYDYIVHCASPTNGKYIESHPTETFDLAYQTTKNMLEWGTHFDCFLYVSSLEYYGQVLDDKLITEDMEGYIDTKSPRSAYPLGKRAAEELCKSFAREYGIPAKIARLTQTFGAGVAEDDNRVFAQFARSAIRGEDIILHTKGMSAKPYCYTTDAISAMLYILLKGDNGEAYNVANKDSYISICDLAHFVQERFNRNAKVVISLNDSLGYAPQTMLRLDISKIEQLGWHPIYNLEDMFSRLIAYMSD